MNSKDELVCKCKNYDAEFNGTWFPMVDKTKCPIHSGYTAEELKRKSTRREK